MKAIILAGGLGSRISEESSVKPKPMIEIGGKPIIWHIMKIYSHYGINDFVICCGYKGYLIKEYFANYSLHTSDVTIDMSNNNLIVHQRYAEPWKVTLVDTGEHTMTGGRIKRIAKYVKDEELFCMTYGDGLIDLDINKLISFHKKQNVKASLTAVIPPGRFGALDISSSKVISFKEKPKGDGSKINGGFFVLSSSVIDYIKDDMTIWEENPLETLASEGNLAAFEHKGFWYPMDTLRDKILLDNLWNNNKAQWKVWE